MAAIEPGKKAPSFQLKGVDKKEYSLARLQKGQVAVVAFFKKNCPTCHLAFPFLEKLYRHHQHDQNVRMFAVAQEDKAGANEFIEGHKITMPVALDENPYKVSAEYGLANVPTVFLVDADGYVKQTNIGFVKTEYEELAKNVASASGKQPAAIFEGASVPELKPG